MGATKAGGGYAAAIEGIADKLLGFISMEVPEECEYCAVQIDETVKCLLTFEKPKVMVYGIYNSGKSTLINALMKQEVAEMADRPMTDRISEFDRGEYILIDSPGIDAPIAHERITNDFLNKCHIILFVISSKGGFEGVYNYQKMAELINKDIPFVIVLNDRGCEIKQEWSADEKALKRAEHDQELKSIQYKVIENLKRVTGDKNIAEKYEVYVLNAKKALTGIQKKQTKLYETSNIAFLDRRIIQLVQTGSAMKVLQQPVKNLKTCFDYVEARIVEEMQAGSERDYAAKINMLRAKQENLKDEMRVFIRGIVDGRIDEITGYYAANNAEAAEGTEYSVFQEIEDRYTAKFVVIMDEIKRTFSDIDGISTVTDTGSNLIFAPRTKDYSTRNMAEEMDSEEDEAIQIEEERHLIEFLVSRRRREREKRARQEREAELKNEQSLNKLNEQIRIRQEARQFAASDMYELQNLLIDVVNAGISEKFEEVISFIQDIDCENKLLRDEGKRKLKELADIRKSLAELESKVFN